jgi:hypothetical protein
VKKKKPMNLEFEPVHPKNVLLAPVVHGIFCLFTNLKGKWVATHGTNLNCPDFLIFGQ